MATKYFYGLEGEERYTHDNIDSFLEEEGNDHAHGDKIEVVEMKPTRGEKRWCSYLTDFIPDCLLCPAQKFIGKSHICAYLGWGLSATGAKWECTFTGDSDGDVVDYLIKKLSGRKK